MLLVGVLFSSLSFAQAEESPLPSNLAQGDSVTVQAMENESGSSEVCQWAMVEGFPPLP